MQKLSAEQLHALAIVGKQAAKVRKELKPVDYAVDFTVHVSGTLNVSGDQIVSSTSTPSTVTIAALLLGQFGPKKRKQLIEAIAAGTHDALAIDEELRELAQNLIQSLTKSTGTTTRKGSVAGKLVAELQ
jgi:hypothetical protein